MVDRCADVHRVLKEPSNHSNRICKATITCRKWTDWRDQALKKARTLHGTEEADVTSGSDCGALALTGAQLLYKSSYVQFCVPNCWQRPLALRSYCGGKRDSNHYRPGAPFLTWTHGQGSASTRRGSLEVTVDHTFDHAVRRGSRAGKWRSV